MRTHHGNFYYSLPGGVRVHHGLFRARAFETPVNIICNGWSQMRGNLSRGNMRCIRSTENKVLP